MHVHHRRLLKREGDHATHFPGNDAGLLRSPAGVFLLQDHFLAAVTHHTFHHRVRIIGQLRAQEYSAAAAGDAQPQLSGVLAEEEHPALGIGQLQPRVNESRHDLLEGGSAVQSLRKLQQNAQVMELRCRALGGFPQLFKQARQLRLVHIKAEGVVVRDSQADLVAGLEQGRSDSLAVQVRSVTALGIFNKITMFSLNNASVVPRDATV